MAQLERGFVDALGGESIKGIGGRRDEPFDRDRFGLELARIAAAIPPFMVSPGDRGRNLQNLGIGATEDAITDFCMLRDHIELLLGKLARLEEYMIRSADF